MLPDQHQITKEGLDSLMLELDELNRKLQDTSIRIKEAKEFGDISENSELDAATAEQAMLQLRKEKLEQIIENATLIDTTSSSLKTVSAGLNVTLHDFDFDEEVTYQLVGEAEADPLAGKLSISCPVGMAIIGKKKGDVVEVHVPEGISKYKIVKIFK